MWSNCNCLTASKPSPGDTLPRVSGTHLIDLGSDFQPGTTGLVI